MESGSRAWWTGALLAGVLGSGRPSEPGLLTTAQAAAGRSPEPSVYHPSDLSEVSITLDRTACFGECPVYSIRLDGKGHVQFQGERYVAKPGTHEWTVGPEVVEHLLKLFERVNFLDMEFDCKRTIHDAPTQRISLHIGNRDRTLGNRWMGPGEFDLVNKGMPLDPDLDGHALIYWLAGWIDTALGTEPYVQPEQPR